MTEPRGGHELTVFVVPAHLGPHAAPAVDEVVARAGGANTDFAWLVVEDRVRALRPPAAHVSGAELAAHCAAPGPGGAELAEGLAMAAGLAERYLAGRADGLPPAVDVLAVADDRCALDAGAWAAPPSGGIVQTGFVLHAFPGADELPAAVRRVHADRLDGLGLLWTLLRYRHRAFRRPPALLG